MGNSLDQDPIDCPPNMRLLRVPLMGIKALDSFHPQANQSWN